MPVREARLPNLREPHAIDVLASEWGVAAQAMDAAFNANMIHIAPGPAASECCAG